MQYDKPALSDTQHHIQSLGPQKGQTVHSPQNEPTAVTRQFHSQRAQSKPQKPRPLTCAGTEVGTGRDRRVRTPSADCSELGSRQRRHQPHYLSSTISSAAAMQRPGASTLYRPSLSPTRIRQTRSLLPSKNGISPPAATAHVIETRPATFSYHR